MSLRDGEVISLEALKALTRRDFVRVTGVGLVTIAVPACGGEMMAGPADMATPAADDLARPPDLATPSDLAMSRADMSMSPDIAMSQPDLAKPDIAMSQPDLATPDLSRPADMANQPADMANQPADLSQPDIARAPDLSQPDLSQPPDLAQRPPDMAQSPPDMAGACGGNAFDTGMRGPAYAVNTATFMAKPRVFICRDRVGLYAVTSICTHAGCDVNEMAPMGFACPCHGSQYDFDGNNTVGPAFRPLVHFALCLVGNGNVGVDTTIMVATNQRYPY